MPSARYALAPRDYLRLDDPGLGSGRIDYTTTDDQGDKIQAAIELAALDSRPVLLAGDIVSYRGLVFPGNVHLIGTGSGDSPDSSSAVLRFPDLGVGERCVTFQNAGLPWAGQDFMISGPRAFDPIPVGTQPVGVSGIYAPTRGILRNVRVSGCNNAVELINDHQEFYSCDLQNNVVGINFIENPAGGLGDLLFERCILTTQSHASIAVADSGTMQFARFVQGHCGTAPFGIWRYPRWFAATGSSASNVITGVPVVEFIPNNTMTITGPNIPDGTTISSVAGTPGDYTLTLSATPTGTVTKALIGSRTTFIAGDFFENFSWEYCSHAEIYDQVSEIAGATPATVSNITYDATGSSSTFTGNLWQQVPVAATGSGASDVLTGVVLTAFEPMEGFEVTGTNIPAGARVLSYSGTSGNYSLKLSKTPTGTVTFVTVGQPTDLAAIDCAQAQQIHWRDGVSPTLQPDRNMIAANSIFGVTVEYGGPVQNVPFRIKGAYNANSVAAAGIRYGTTDGPGGSMIIGAVTDDGLLQYDLVEWVSYEHVRKHQGAATSLTAGVVLRVWSQGDIAMVTTAGRNSDLRVHTHTSTGAISAGALVKPDSSHPGYVVEASGPTDGPVGKLISSIAAGGASGEIRVQL